MEVLLEILIRASIGIALFYALYWLLLRQSTHFKANRLFLLISLMVAVLLALVPIQYQVLVQTPSSPALSDYSGVFNRDIANTPNDVQNSNGISLLGVLLIIYSIGAAIVLLRLLIQCRKPMLIITQSKPKKIYDCLIYENKEFNSPFSFFNRILINPEYFKQDEIYDILTHEKVHIQERHWIDLFIIELLTVFFWFNPFIWFFERAIKQNHEYLADKGVLSLGHSPVRYQALLINRLMGTQVIGLANHFNSSLGLNRFKMMTKEKTSKRKLFRMIWGVPVLALLLMAFAQPDYKMQTQEKTKTVKIPENKELEHTLPDGTVVTIMGGTTFTYPVKFTEDKREVTLDGEAYFNVSDSKVPFVVKNKKGEIIGSNNSGSEMLKPINSTDYTKSEKSTPIKVKGTVKDDKGNPMPGASIVLRGTTTGTVADKDGTFKLEVLEDKEWSLVVSYVGYKTIENQVEFFQDKTDLDFKIVLQREVISIDSKEMENAGDVPPPPPPAPEFDENSDKPVFFIVESMPEYKQGRYGLAQYVKKQKRKLKAKFGKKLEGKATVGFTVDTKGNVTNIQLLDKTSETTARAAKIIAKEMEQWKPGSQRGKKVSVDFAIKLEF
ncbi:FecR family protein [Ancylomarina subtilis]|uniref:FecR family protein n=1 Tax=Ancylomarina subtilis TaxID=1639035 RepID=A0A4Q7VKV8_9BACT|nr:carboxypeptidase-like regulatory domain-containing protein [Ancylomarina subtilis]RZT96863.1 FecR family protein [Ancylomarina subtilis]